MTPRRVGILGVTSPEATLLLASPAPRRTGGATVLHAPDMLVDAILAFAVEDEVDAARRPNTVK